MIEVLTELKGQITVSENYPYEKHDYKILLWHLIDSAHEGDCVAITAAGIHLDRICEHFNGIVKPNGKPPYGFVWVGNDAKMILANIALALEHDVTVVVDTVTDYKFD